MGQGSALTKTGIGNTPETATYQDSPQATVAAFGKQSVAPEMQSNTYTPGLQFDDSGNVSSDAGPQPAFLQTKAAVTPKFQKPSFQETENNPDLAKKADTKGGKLLSFFLSVANGGAAGAGQPTFGGGFAMAQQAGLQRQQVADRAKQQQFENQRQQREDQVRQQQADQQGQLYNSEITKNAALTSESNSRTNNRELTDEQKVASKKAIALSNGMKEGTPEYNQYVFGVTKAEAPEKKLSVEDQLVYGDPNSPEYKRAKDVFARQHRVPAGENDRAYNDRLKKDTSKFYADIVAKQGGTDKALEFIYGRLKSGELTDYQKQVAAEAVSKLRGEQAQFLR
jgi:hypothetical protein